MIVKIEEASLWGRDKRDYSMGLATYNSNRASTTFDFSAGSFISSAGGLTSSCNARRTLSCKAININYLVVLHQRYDYEC